MGDSLLEMLSARAYEPPLSERLWNGQIRDLSDPVNVGLLLVAFEIQLLMNGIADGLGNMGDYTHEIVQALVAIECKPAAAVLSRILDVARQAGMTPDAIEADRSAFAPGSITSFRERHGDKWRAALDEMWRLEEELEFEQIRAALEAFIHTHRERFEVALRP